MEEIHVLHQPLKARRPPISYHSPPPPPPPLASSSSVTSVPILAISILGIITTSILLVSYYVFVIKCCLSWRRSDVISRLYDSRSRRQRWRDDDPFARYAADAGKRGLEEAVIRAIPIFPFRAAAAGPFQECAVCLNEFEEGERLRRLPTCSHAFHIDCIDVWLQSNANCPLCRSDITGVGILPTAQALAQGAYQDTSPRSGGVAIEVRDDNSDGPGGLTPRSEASMQQQQAVVPAGQRQPSPRKAEQRMAQQHKVWQRFHAACSMGDEFIDVRTNKDDQFSVPPVRRSFSLDSSCDRQLYLSVQEVLLHNPRYYCREIVSGEGSSSSCIPPAGRVRRPFFSFGRSSRSVVLPLAVEP